jgi:cell division protein ZapA (FtsZ GTPase activity inhibitor)
MSAAKVNLTILNRLYTFSVPEEDVERLKAAADLLNVRADAVRAMDRTLTPERIAISAALQIAFDAIQGRLGDIPEDEATIKRLATLRFRCDQTLDPLP